MELVPQESINGFKAFFIFENSIRLLLYLLTRSKYTPNWMEEFHIPDRAGPDSAKGRSVLSISNERINMGKNFGNIAPANNFPFSYLSFDEIIEMVTAPKFWDKYMRCLFPEVNNSRFRSELEMLRSLRNDVAHFRPISNTSVTIIKDLSNNLFCSASEYVKGALLPFKEVPFNLPRKDDSWYEGLISLDGGEFPLEFSMSRDSRWVCIAIKFIPKGSIYPNPEFGLSGGLGSPKPISRFYMKVSCLDTPKVLWENKIINRSVAYVVEDCEGYVDLDEVKNSPIIEMWKKVYFVFSRKALQVEKEGLVSEFQEFLTKVNRENELALNPYYLKPAILGLEKKIQAEFDDGSDTWLADFGPMCVRRKGNHPFAYWGMFEDIEIFGDVDQEEYNYFVSPPFLPWQIGGNITLHKF